MEELEYVEIETDSGLKEMSKNVPDKGQLGFANNNVLLPDRSGTPISRIPLTDLGKQLVPGSTRNRIQDFIYKHGLKEQDFTETFLKRAHAFGMSDDGKEWCKTTAWCFGKNFAKVVAEREEQKNKQQKRRDASKASLGSPPPPKRTRQQ
jgi:hypothetical protein